MKIRQKSFLLSTALVSGVLFLCMFFLILPNFRASVSAVEARALGEEKTLALAIDGLLSGTPKEEPVPTCWEHGEIPIPH